MSSPEKQPKQESKMNPQQLRKRRNQILRDQANEYREVKKIKDVVSTSSTKSTSHFAQLYVVIGTALIVTICAGLNYTRPGFIFNRKKPPPPYLLATLYPPTVDVERDLPRFFRTYSIATPDNKEARRSVKKIVASRNAMRKGLGNLKVLLKAWDGSNINRLLERNYCGADFRQAYHATTSHERQADLVMWCMLATRVSEGVFLEAVQMTDSPFVFAKRRGIVVQSSSTNNRLSNAFYLHPRNLPYDSTLAVLPSKVLTWILANPEEVVPDLVEYRQMLQAYIYELVHSDGNDDNKYLILEEVCQQNPPKRAVGKVCNNNDDICCYFVVPESEGGRFGESSSDSADEKRRSLRDGARR